MNAANDIRILSWHPQYQPYFEQLNKHWISKYFKLEPVDYEVLENPAAHIIAHGGDIIFVAVGNEIAGTVAYKRVDEETVEMTKMAVDEGFQGRKLGWALGVAIQERAAEAGYTKMVLYSSRQLTPAITMYHKLGFKEAELEKGGYERCDIKMAIDLKVPPMLDLGKKLRQTVEKTAARLMLFTDEEAGIKPLPSKWSKKEILGHLIDSAVNNYTRFVRARQSDYTELPGYNQDFWVSVRQYQRSNWEELVLLWKTINQHIVAVLPSIRAGHICAVGQDAPVTLEFLATDYLRHLQHHVDQIFPVHANY